MEEATYQCRKCREVLFVQSNLANIEDAVEECQITTQIFLEETKAPLWIMNIIEHDLFTKGKLNCPKCKGRVGAFDFVTHILCGCGQHKLPPIRVHCDRVDNITGIPNIRSTLKIPRRKNPSSDLSESNVSRNIDSLKIREDCISSNDSVETSECATSNEELYSKNNYNGGETLGATCTVNHEGNFVYDSENAEGICVLESVNKYNVLENEAAAISIDNEEVSELAATVIDQDPFTCPVCLELFYLPQQCEPCKHIFCDPCLRQLNANTLYGASVKCPLCRNVINSCSIHKEYHETIKTKFPDEHVYRRKIEKKNKHLLPNLPGMPLPLRRRRGNNGNNRNANSNITILAGVCFVVLATMMGFTVFAVTVGFVSWYLLEIAIELVVDLTTELSTFFELLRSLIIVLCIDGTLKEEHLHSLFNSSSRIIMAFAKVVDSNRDSSMTRHKEPTILQSSDNVNNIKENMSDRSNEFTKMTQATIANYVLVGSLVTYLLYRLAKYLQTVRAGR